VRSDPRDVVESMSLSKKTYSKMVQNLLRATGYNSSVGAVLMSASTMIVAINARFLKK